MNKTIIININGIVFHIEEEAYEVLRKYMTDIKAHFSYSKDSDEIVTDIENRLAEMFNERLASQNKQVVEVQDVVEVTAQMGTVNDFAREDEEDNFTQSDNLKIGKKLHRDIDDKIIAGVCSGLGHYFEIEIKWVRVLFVLSVLLSGTGLVAYAILWLVMPEARTRQEKMAMKGEAINLQNFKRSFDEEVNTINASYSSGNYQRTGDTIGDALQSITNLISKILNFVVKLIGGFIVFAGSIALMALIVGFIFTLGFYNNQDINFFPLSAINPEYKSALYFSAFILLIIPLAALLLFAIRVIFNKNLISRTGSFAMLVLWLTGLAMGVFYGSKIASEFKEDARFEQNVSLTPAAVYHLKLNPSKLLTHEDSLRLHLNKGEFNGNILEDYEEDKNNGVKKFHLEIERSDDILTPQLIKKFSARGATFEDALENAQNIGYNFSQVDSNLLFDKYLYIKNNKLFREQQVKLTLKLPLNSKLIIDDNLNSHVHNRNLWECKPKDSKQNYTEWLVTNDGLKCLSDSIAVDDENQ